MVWVKRERRNVLFMLPGAFTVEVGGDDTYGELWIVKQIYKNQKVWCNIK